MDKKTIKLLMALLLVSVFLVSLCVENKEGLGMVTTTENVETPPTTAETIASTAQPTGIPLNDIQKEACASADEGGTCETKLRDLDFVSPEDCCKYLGKCCPK